MKAVFALAIVAALVALSFQQSTTTIEPKTTEPKVDPKVESTTPSSGSTTTVVTPTSSLKPDQKSDVPNTHLKGNTIVKNSAMNLQSTLFAAMVPLAFVLNRMF